MHAILFEIPFEWFVCPVTKEKLVRKGNEAVSSQGKYRFNPKSRFWNFIPKNFEKLQNLKKWITWKKLQDNALISYKNDPEHNLSVGKRKDCVEFAKFCEYEGKILDIGCGPQKIPAYFLDYDKNKVSFIGIDPLVGEQPRDFAYVQGLGEYLPFPNKFFDQVLFATSLDHFINPQVALSEAKRVLKDTGTICIWFGEKDKNIPKPKRSLKYFKKLHIPEKADDAFHFKKFSNEEFLGYLLDIELVTECKKAQEVNEWISNFFYRLIKINKD